MSSGADVEAADAGQRAIRIDGELIQVIAALIALHQDSVIRSEKHDVGIRARRREGASNQSRESACGSHAPGVRNGCGRAAFTGIKQVAITTEFQAADFSTAGAGKRRAGDRGKRTIRRNGKYGHAELMRDGEEATVAGNLH